MIKFFVSLFTISILLIGFYFIIQGCIVIVDKVREIVRERKNKQ